MHECELNDSTHNSHDQELVENPNYKYHAAKVRNVLEFNPPLPVAENHMPTKRKRFRKWAFPIWHMVRSTVKLGKLDSTYDAIDIFTCDHEDIKFIFTCEDVMFSQ